MAGQYGFEFENNVLRSFVDDHVAVLHFKCGVFDTMIDLGESGKLFHIMEMIRKAPDIKALVLINSPQCFNEENYVQFIEKILDTEKTDTGTGSDSGFRDKISRSREINILSRVILQLIEFKKITISALQNEVVTPFFGASLSCDFRLAADDMCFCLTHLQYGLHPSGALPFFLPKYLSHGKAMEILLQGGRISARKALDMGLVTAVYPTAEFETRCLEEAKKISNIDIRSVRSTKRLIYFSRDELVDYFDCEMEMSR